MREHTGPIYEFGRFQLDPEQRMLIGDGATIVLTPKAFDILVFLVQNRGRILKKDELMTALWPGSFVEDGNLSQNIFVLRKILGDDRNGNSFIQTIPRIGYRFLAPVREAAATTASPGLLKPEYWRQHNPFRSLQMFQTEDAWLFFGRAAETQDLVTRVCCSPVLAVVGNSGSGKSSLIRAGLIAALQEGRFGAESQLGDPPVSISWRIAVLRPSAAPFDYLAEVLPSQLAPELSVKEQAEFIAECRTKFSGGDALRNAISALSLARGNVADEDRQTRVLLVVDQFEEIFTRTGQPQVRKQYIDGLLSAAHLDGAVPVHLVLGLRADFYGYCLDHAGLSRCLETSLYNVPRMSPEQMRESIEKRLQLAGASAEPGLVDALLEDVGAEPGNLALLEHALGQLWESCGGAGGTLTNQTYAEIGRLRGALGRHADNVYQNLDDEKQRRLAQRIFLDLVHLGEGAQDTRRRVTKTALLALDEPPKVEALLASLASSRLIATGREAGETFVEVSHEALIREWPALREWLTQNREELALERRLFQAAEEWQSLKQEPSALLQGARLAQGEEWLSRHSDAHPLLREYLTAGAASRTEAARKEAEAHRREMAQERLMAALARRSAVRLRWFSCALAALLLAAIGAAWFAHKQQTISESHALSAQSAELLPRDHGQALNLAVRSWRTARTEEAHLAVAKALPEQLAVFMHEGPVITAKFSPDGQRILSADDHIAWIWDANDPRLLTSVHSDEKIEYDAFSPDGQSFVTAEGDHTAQLWNAADGRQLAAFGSHKAKVDTYTIEAVAQAAFSPDGRRLAIKWREAAQLWDAGNGRLLATLQEPGDVNDVAFSPDG